MSILKVSRTWPGCAALLAQLAGHSGCAPPPASSRGAAGPQQSRASETQSVGARGADAPHSPAGWVGLTRLTAPPERDECHFIGDRPWLSWQGEGERARPVAITRLPARVDPLPFEPPEVLKVAPDSGSSRIVIKVDDGWLVAMHRGEFGGGLFWVGASLQVQRLDAELGEYVGWIGKLESGVVGVSGLCHGEACTHRTTVYSVLPAPDAGWRLRPLALFDGCPGAVNVGAAAQSVLVGASCGGLQRIDRDGPRQVAAWPKHLYPIQVSSTAGGEQADELYQVSFGRVAASFGPAGAEWFARADCAAVVSGPSNRCSCVPAR